MRSRRKLLWFFALLAIAPLLLFTRQAPTTTDWLAVSKPVLTTTTNAQDGHGFVCLALSNSGPRALRFDLVWIDCRTRAGLKPVAVKFPKQLAASNSTQLRPRRIVQIPLELEGNVSDESCFFSCEIKWVEQRSDFQRLAAWAQRPVYWIASLLGMEWKPPWGSKRIATGEVFAANVELVDYFRQTYGLTPTFLAEEEQRARQAAQELQKLQASLPANHGVAFASSGRPLTAEEQLAHNAKAAYVDFYTSFGDKLMPTEPGTSPNGGPAAPLTNSGVSAGRHR